MNSECRLIFTVSRNLCTDDTQFIAWKMSAPHIILVFYPFFVPKKLSQFVRVWRSFDRNHFAGFFETFEMLFLDSQRDKKVQVCHRTFWSRLVCLDVGTLQPRVTFSFFFCCISAAFGFPEICTAGHQLAASYVGLATTGLSPIGPRLSCVVVYDIRSTCEHDTDI